jgi:hypothetical protein
MLADGARDMNQSLLPLLVHKLLERYRRMLRWFCVDAWWASTMSGRRRQEQAKRMQRTNLAMRWSLLQRVMICYSSGCRPLAALVSTLAVQLRSRNVSFLASFSPNRSVGFRPDPAVQLRRAERRQGSNRSDPRRHCERQITGWPTLLCLPPGNLRDAYARLLGLSDNP